MMENAQRDLERFVAGTKDVSRRLSGEELAAWLATLNGVRWAADYYERELIRYLKYTLKLRWQDVADILGLATKQAAQQRWRRLAPNTSREIRRGRGAKPIV